MAGKKHIYVIQMEDIKGNLCYQVEKTINTVAYAIGEILTKTNIRSLSNRSDYTVHISGIKSGG